MDTIFDQILTADESQLAQIKQAVRDESILLRRAVSQLHVGSRIRFNDKTKPRYLVGQEAEVTSFNPKTVVVRLVNGPTGKFSGEKIRVPHSLIEVV